MADAMSQPRSRVGQPMDQRVLAPRERARVGRVDAEAPDANAGGSDLGGKPAGGDNRFAALLADMFTAEAAPAARTQIAPETSTRDVARPSDILERSDDFAPIERDQPELTRNQFEKPGNQREAEPSTTRDAEAIKRSDTEAQQREAQQQREASNAASTDRTYEDERSDASATDDNTSEISASSQTTVVPSASESAGQTLDGSVAADSSDSETPSPFHETLLGDASAQLAAQNSAQAQSQTTAQGFATQQTAPNADQQREATSQDAPAEALLTDADGMQNADLATPDESGPASAKAQDADARESSEANNALDADATATLETAEDMSADDGLQQLATSEAPDASVEAAQAESSADADAQAALDENLALAMEESIEDSASSSELSLDDIALSTAGSQAAGALGAGSASAATTSTSSAAPASTPLPGTEALRAPQSAQQQGNEQGAQQQNSDRSRSALRDRVASANQPRFSQAVDDRRLDVVRQVSKAIGLRAISKPEGSLSLLLRPDSLGTIRLNFQFGGDGALDIEAITEQSATRHLLAASADDLRLHLRQDASIDLGKFLVREDQQSYRGGSNEQSAQDFSQRFSQDAQGRRDGSSGRGLAGGSAASAGTRSEEAGTGARRSVAIGDVDLTA